MMSENKLKKLAIILSKNIKDGQSPTDIYFRIMKIAVNQKEYFINYIGLPNLIKIIIYCYSYVETNQFNLADNILKNLSFITLFSHGGENSVDSCDICGGNGTNQCDNCSGRGEIKCPYCSINGKVKCPSCYGSGQDYEDRVCDECNGDGTITCEECYGDAYRSCKDCDGDGRIECESCEGSGEIESEKIGFELTSLITWDAHLIRLAEKSYENEEFFMNTEDLIQYEDKYILTDIDTFDDVLADWVEPFVYYPVIITDEPNLRMSGNQKNITWSSGFKNLNKFKA